MVSAGDTDISLHIRPGPISNLVWGGVFWGSQNSKYSKCQDLPNFQFSGGGEDILGKSKLKILYVLHVLYVLYVLYMPNFQLGVYSGEVETQNTLPYA